MSVLHRHCRNVLMNRQAPAALHRLHKLHLAVTLVALTQPAHKERTEEEKEVAPAKPNKSIMHLPTDSRT